MRSVRITPLYWFIADFAAMTGREMKKRRDDGLDHNYDVQKIICLRLHISHFEFWW